MGFLGLVIEEDGIKMEKKKIKRVLDWPRPKCIKNIQKKRRVKLEKKAEKCIPRSEENIHDQTSTCGTRLG